jgi:hypothetical protein
MICIPKLALEIQDLLLPAAVLPPRLDDTCYDIRLDIFMVGQK